MTAVAGLRTPSSPAAASVHPLMVGLAALFLGIRLIHLLGANVFMDEAYYWLWGQRPDLSYFDHPPINAWGQGIAAALLGWNRLALRFMVAVSLFLDIGVLYLFARRLSGPRWQETFWPTLLLFLATPIFFAVTGLAVPDHWLTFFRLLSLYGFTSFLQSVEAGRQRLRWLYLGALALGLAALAKYNAVLLGIAFGLFVLLSPRFRPLLRGPHLYLAALLALAIQTPVILWNVENSLSSFGFILAGRHAGVRSPTSLSGVTGYLLGALAFLSPFGLYAIARLLFARVPKEAGLGLARTVFAVSTLAMLAASLFTDILFHWNLVAYLGVLPFLSRWFRSAWLWAGHLLYSLLFAGIVLLNYSAIPLMALISYADQTSAWSYGWPEIAARMQRAQAETSAEFLAGTDYTLASPLAFALGTAGGVTSLSPRRDQFDYWLPRQALGGADGIVVADRFRPFTEAMQRRFEQVDLLGQVEVWRYGIRIDTYQIYLAQGLKP